MRLRWRRSLWVLCLLAAIVASVAYVVSVERQRAEEARAESGSGGPPQGAPHPARLPPTSEQQHVKIGWTAWADAEIVTRLVARILEDRFDRRVDLLMSDIGIQYQGVASGDLDVMLMAWLPRTHAAFFYRVAGDVVDLGPIYSHARIGWAVPSYVPPSELSAIPDLAKPLVMNRLGGKIQGIDPGSGLMQASERALDAYALDGFSLVSASGAAMAAALDRAIRKHEWIVVTAWNPHWMFARFDLRYLRDPKGVFGREERVHALVSRRFADAGGSDVIDFLTRLFIPREELERAMLDANEHDVATAVAHYLAEHPRRIDYWVTGAAERRRVSVPR